MEKPNPGSKEAVMAGCTCPIIDNHHGKGRPSFILDSTEPDFWITDGCPIHDLSSNNKE